MFSLLLFLSRKEAKEQGYTKKGFTNIISHNPISISYVTFLSKISAWHIKR
jgi:Zn-finger domain-containing protein